MELARRHYDKEQYVLAVHNLSNFLQRESGSRDAAEAYYLRGLCYRQMDGDKVAPARADFEQAIKKSGKKSMIYRLAKIALGHIYFESTAPNYEQAMKYYQDVLEKLEDAPPKDVVLYRIGAALQGLGRWSEADLYFSRCFDKFGQAPVAEEARRRFGAEMFQLQVATSDSLEEAEELVEQLKQSGWEGNWFVQRKNDTIVYSVRTGHYHTFIEAQKGLNDLTVYYPDAIMIAGKLPASPTGQE